MGYRGKKATKFFKYTKGEAINETPVGYSPVEVNGVMSAFRPSVKARVNAQTAEVPVPNTRSLRQGRWSAILGPKTTMSPAKNRAGITRRLILGIQLPKSGGAKSRMIAPD